MKGGNIGFGDWVVYLLMPEDSTAGPDTGIDHHRARHFSTGNGKRQGTFKAVFWTIVAVLASLAVASL